MNQNKFVEVTCPVCEEKRMARDDVVKKITKAGRPLNCKPCNNRLRFADKDHPRKGTGIKNNPDLEYTRRSYYKAQRRVRLGAKHHKCYANVLFKFSSLQELIDCIGIRPQGATLDRVDPLGHYEASNVRWATMAEQRKNCMPRNYWKDK